MPHNQPLFIRKAGDGVRTANAVSSTTSLIAGSFYHQISRIWDDRIAEYLLAPDSRRHVWHCWLASPTANLDRPELYQFLTFARSKQIVADGYGWSPHGLLSALSKLGAQARSKEFYAALFEVLARGGPMAKHVQHLSELDDETIVAMDTLDVGVLPSRAVKTLLRRSPNSLGRLCWVAGRLAKLMPDAEVATAIAKTGHPVSVLRQLVSQFPLPEAPFAVEDERLRPIGTAQDLLDVGRAFRNCVADPPIWIDCVLSIQTGERYYYRWEGETPALLAFSRVGFLGWKLAEIEGPRGRPVSDFVRRQIDQVLRKVPVICPDSDRFGSFLL